MKDYRWCWRGYVGPWAAGVQKPSGKRIQDMYSDWAEDAATSTPATDFYCYSDSKQSLFRDFIFCVSIVLCKEKFLTIFLCLHSSIELGRREPKFLLIWKKQLKNTRGKRNKFKRLKSKKSTLKGLPVFFFFF